MSRQCRTAAVLLLAAASVACLPIPTPSPTVDPQSAASPTPTSTLDPTPTQWSTPTPTELPPVEITVYFTDFDNYASATLPYEVGVTRVVSGSASLPEAVLDAFFVGPTPDETAAGLVAITSNCTGFSALEIEDTIARVYLTGPCNSGGATYSVAVLLAINLTQFDEVTYVKIYDENGQTGQPDGYSNSIPAILEP
ncbi:MAG: hypothetical protein E3J64_04385 [Anaerolineales bacterium]|nr:MAG: hypothetical protein E3J64_04385 [Anaerolineales bacterium]